MKTFENADLKIAFNPAQVRELPAKSPMLALDEIHMRDGTVWLVTGFDDNRIELMRKSRLRVPIAGIAQFLEGAAYIKRATCWEEDQKSSNEMR